MHRQRPDQTAIFVFVGLLLVLAATTFLIIKSINFKKLSQIKVSFPSPTPTVVINKKNIAVTKYNLPSVTPTVIPTIHKNPTPTTKDTPVCHRLNITESEFAGSKCYKLADYTTLVSVLSKYRTAKSRLQFANTSISITCNCQTKRACDFFKESCANDKETKAKAEADLNLYRTQIQLLLARGW